MKVSVIVPVYNVYDYLDKCLDSLVKQTLKDIEIIVVNDGSPDNSQEIIDKYAKKYPKLIKAYQKKNGGLSSARNFGISKAKGEYIIFIDSDDYVEYDMLEEMYKKAKTTSADVVSCQLVYHYRKFVDQKKLEHPEYFGKKIIDEPRILLEVKSYAVNKIYKRELWNDFRFPDQHFEDSAVVYNVLLTANKIECINGAKYHYIKERGEAITSNTDDRIYDIFKSCDAILSFYQEKDCYNSIKDTLDRVILGHIGFRIKSFMVTYQADDLKKYVYYAHDYLDKKIVDWRKNNYLKFTFKNTFHNNLYHLVFKNKFMLNLYVIYLKLKRIIKRG